VNPTDTGGAGGGLPLTGPQTGLIGAAGALLVAAGLAGFIATRRRRTRFQA
jgi:LPXTG-motif cell wall-anchored protein